MSYGDGVGGGASSNGFMVSNPGQFMFPSYGCSSASLREGFCSAGREGMKNDGTVLFIKHRRKSCTFLFLDCGPFGKRRPGVLCKISFIVDEYTEINNKAPVMDEDSTIPGVPVLFYVRLSRSCVLQNCFSGCH